jgi:tetratricopeptide (TPR) repeat protein
MFFLKTSLILCITIYFSFGQVLPAYSYTEIPEYLCEIGIKYYNEGNYDQALREFKKVLIISPDNKLAQEYIELIDQSQSSVAQFPETGEDVPLPKTVAEPDRYFSRQSAINEALSSLETESALAVPASAKYPEVETTHASKKTSIPRILFLDQRLNDIRAAIEIEKDKTIILRGENISRFLDTVPNIVRIEKLNENEIALTGYDYGYTYVHVWDARGRWTLELLCVPKKPEGMTLAEELRKSAESAGAFKLRYALDWSELETGKKPDELHRTSYSWNHWLSLNGQTPYGDFYSQTSLRTLKENTDLTYFTVGLEKGKLGVFNDFAIRGFDFAPNISNLAFSSPSLRGVMFQSPAFEKKLDYTVFWGREGGGKYAGLSPGLNQIQDSFLEGVNLNLSLIEKQLWSLSVIHGYGEDRPDYLNPYGYDFKLAQGFNRWKLDYEIAQDTEKFAHLFNASYSIPNFKVSTELRDTAKDFHTMTGGGWRSGEIGALTNANYKPSENLEINSRLDIFQDRVYPNPKNENWLNEDFNIDANYIFNQATSLRADYSFQNELGRLSPLRYHNAGIGFYQAFDWVRRINTYVTYRHQDSMYFSSHSNDFVNDKVIMGLRTNIVADLYYYANREMNWLNAKFTNEHSQPNAFETGLDWNRQIFKSPFYGNFRLTYRDEEDTVSPVSILSGEDYLEAYAEITYRPRPDFEAYCSARAKNIWSDNPSVVKRVDASIYAGLRYTWDTGLHWNPVGTIEGIAFKDLNYDGLRQNDEPAVEGIKIFLGKDRSQITDKLGGYRFSRIRARKAYINLDTTTIPAGFVLTTPASQEVKISQSGVVEVNFGLASRTEISGIIFEDTDNNGKFNGKDKGLKGVEIVLEDGTRAKTNETGRYTFGKAKVGIHTLKLDLNSLPSNYLPTIPILKEIDLTEGAVYIHNIPLNKLPD